MTTKIHAVQPRDSAAEQSRERHRRPAKVYDFTKLVEGKRKKRKPAYCRRDDGQHLFYHGKENALYGETEAGKDMLLCETVAQCLEWGDAKVSWIDFEEGDEIDVGTRLLQMGIEPAQLVDQDLFRFSTPEDVEQARDSIHDAKMTGCDLVIFNGLQAMYGLFGWELYDPTSPALFRQMISPLLKAGRTIIETDHMTKTSAEGKNGSRYAAGGIAKLNWINGAAYIIEAIDPIVQGGVGRSRIVLTKDRPSGVKPHCVRISSEARMMYAGTLVVKSTGDSNGNWSLNVEVKSPEPGSVVQDRKQALKRGESNGQVPDDILVKVLDIYKRYGKEGTSKREIERVWEKLYKSGHRYVRDAIPMLQVSGCLVKGARSKTSNMAQLRYEEDWNPKFRIPGKE
jgi:hypothetical protein